MDSDQDCVMLLRKELKELGYRVDAVKQTKILLRMVRNDLVDVLILAVDAWGAGFDLIPVVKRLNRTLPIIVTSSDDSLETASRVREQGVLFYAIKPLDMHEIESVVIPTLNHSRTHSLTHSLTRCKDPQAAGVGDRRHQLGLGDP